MNSGVIIAFGVGLLLIYIVGKVMLVPFKLIMKFIINAVIGGVALWVINYLGAFVNLHLPINPITALIVGFLGIPGIVLLFVIQQIILK